MFLGGLLPAGDFDRATPRQYPKQVQDQVMGPLGKGALRFTSDTCWFILLVIHGLWNASLLVARHDLHPSSPSLPLHEGEGGSVARAANNHVFKNHVVNHQGRHGVNPSINQKTTAFEPHRSGPLCRYEQRQDNGTITIALTGRAMNPATKRESSRTFSLPVNTVRLTDEEFLEVMRAEFAKALQWCRETASVF